MDKYSTKELREELARRARFGIETQPTKLCECIVCKKYEHHNDAIYCTRCGTKLCEEESLVN